MMGKPVDHRIIGLRNAKSEIGINPKDKIGATKVDLTLCPPMAHWHWATGQMDGATKYGPYNWRVEPIQARTYLGAAMRHLYAFLEGETHAQDSGVHHLGHAMSCCAIVIDAENCGTLVDNRPVKGEFFLASVQDMTDLIKSKPKGWGV